MTRIACLPLDDRPVNYDAPRLLADVAGYEFNLPPREWLGNPWRAARHADLLTWLRQAAASADVLILALDTLAYGGLIPSRTSNEPAAQVLARLQVLQELKALNPGLQILASSVILRVSRDDSAEEEKPYWAEYGSRMFRLSYLEHKCALGEASAPEAAERAALRAQIPDEVYTDYLQGRACNHAVNRAMLDWLAAGVLDYLLLPQDDTADYGWNIAEARRLQAHIRRSGLGGRAITYPGADEIGCLLLARAVCRQHGLAPRVFPRFSASSPGAVITGYEDRPMLELLKAHLAPLDGVLADDPAGADLLLMINAPALAQGVGEMQWAAQVEREELLALLPAAARPYAEALYDDPSFQLTRREMQSPRRSPEEFCRAVLSAVRQGRNVAVADVAFVNGADLILGDLLLQHPESARLAAFGGWNTAGNTLGMVLAQAVIYTAVKDTPLTPRQHKAQLEFLFLRFLDDYAYQAVERSQVMLRDLPTHGLPPGEARLPDGPLAGEIENIVAARLQNQARRLEALFQASGLLRSVQVSDIHLPWQRLFEIGCEVKAELV